MGELNVNVRHYGFPLSGIPFRQILPAGGTDNGNQVEWKFLNLPLSTAKDIVVVYDLAPFKIHRDVVQDRGARHLLKPLKLSTLATADAPDRPASQRQVEDALYDGNRRTAWIGSGVGDTIEVAENNAYISQIAILNGALKSESTYRDFARAKEVEIEVWYRTNPPTVRRVKLPDRAFSDFNDRVWGASLDWLADMGGEGGIRRARIKIISLYPGRRHPNRVGISELFVGAHGS